MRYSIPLAGTPLAGITVLVHLGVGALWLGAMVYSLRIVQPRVARLFPDPAKAEEVYREFAAGNRWPVVGLIGALAASGVGLVLFAASGSGRDGWWWAVVAVKVLLLGAASVAFWWVSWRGWPGRVFALATELPGLQRRFRRVALGMAAMVGTAFVLGVLLAHMY